MFSVRLLATDNADLPPNWTWTVTIQIQGIIRPRIFSFNLPYANGGTQAAVNWVAEYELLRRPPASYRDQIPDYDPYAARRLAEEELKSFNVMRNTLPTITRWVRAPIRSRAPGRGGWC